MEPSSASVGQKSLDEFVDVVAKIYIAHDKNRSIWDVWCHTLHHAASVAEQIRTGETGKILHKEIADFSLWLFTTVLKLRGKFGQSEGTFEAPHDRFIRIQSTCSDLLWHKYPKVCPFCLDRKPASDSQAEASVGSLITCHYGEILRVVEDTDSRRKRATALRHRSDAIRSEMPASIDEWQKMFTEIFEADLAVLTLKDIALRLMEELGEASNAMIRMYSYKEETFRFGEPNWRQTNLELQLADVFSWLFLLVA